MVPLHLHLYIYISKKTSNTYYQVEHNCVRELRAVVKDQGECLSKAQHDLADMRLELLNNLLNK